MISARKSDFGRRLEAYFSTLRSSPLQACPDLQDAQVVAYFLHLRARKPKDSEAG